MRIYVVFLVFLAIFGGCSSESPNSPYGECDDTVFISLANSILGEDHVLSADELETVWKTTVRCRLHCYTETELREVARQNKEEGRKWHLVYIFGKSISEQASACSIETEFDLSTETWANEKQKSGYILIDMHAYFSGSRISDYDDSLESMSCYKQVSGQVFCEALCSFMMYFGADSSSSIYMTNQGKDLIYITDIIEDAGRKSNVSFIWSDYRRTVKVGRQTVDEYSFFPYPAGCFLVME